MPWNGMLAYSQRCYTALACYCVIGGVLSRTTSLHPWALCPTAHRLPPRFAPAYKTLLCFYRDKQRRVRKREGVGGGWAVFGGATTISLYLFWRAGCHSWRRYCWEPRWPCCPLTAHTRGGQPDILPPNSLSPPTVRERVEEGVRPV